MPLVQPGDRQVRGAEGPQNRAEPLALSWLPETGAAQFLRKRALAQTAGMEILPNRWSDKRIAVSLRGPLRNFRGEFEYVLDGSVRWS